MCARRDRFLVSAASKESSEWQIDGKDRWRQRAAEMVDCE
jgi:hypothetical protein